MDYFDLPYSTVVQRVVPKNTFDPFTNSKQKELFTKYVAKIIWKNSLTSETTNLPSKDVIEIQVFHIELKVQGEISTLLDVINKNISYHIIFIVEFNDLIYLSVSPKHPSPLDEAKSIIDWTFKTPWFHKNDKQYKIELRKSLDNVFYEFCQQLSLKPNRSIKNINDLLAYNSKIYSLTKEIERVKRSIASCQQFNKRVELNLKLKVLEQELD